MTARVTSDDLALAREFIFKSPNTGKWNKPHWQAAAFAMAWFIRELPGSPLLMNRVLKLMGNHPDATIAMSEATSLIRAQSLDASILNAGPPTSTQAPPGRSLEEVLEEDLDLNESPITSGQPAPAAGNRHSADDGSLGIHGGGGGDGDGGDDGGADLHTPGRTPPPTFTPTPAPAAVRAAAGVAAAAVRGAANEQVSCPHVHKTIPDVHKTAQKIPVCKYLWRRMLCRRPACAYRHPDLCASPACIPTRAPDCVKFHGRYKEDKEDEDNANKKGSNPAKRSSRRPAQGNGRRGGPPQNRSSSGRSNNRRFPPSSAPRRGDQPPPSTTHRGGSCTR